MLPEANEGSDVLAANGAYPLASVLLVTDYGD